MDPNTRFRLAQSYEQAGDFENAVKQYRELYASDPGNGVVFDALRRVLLLLKEYDDAIALLQQKLLLNPHDLNIRGMLGAAYYQAGKEKEAGTEWDNAIATEPTSPNVYRAIGGVLIENRLLDKAIDLYRRGREACRDPNLFTMELAQMLASSMDYGGATSEYVRWLKQNATQLGFVQSRMAAYTGKEDARAAALSVLQTEIRGNDDVNLQRLAGWLYLEGKRFDEAFEVYRTIDRLSNAQGNELYVFAERTYKEGAYGVAARAYKEAIELPIAGPRMPFAKYGYALALKEQSAAGDTLQPSAAVRAGPVSEAQSRYAGAITKFRQIIADYPHTEFAAKSHYQIGIIHFDRYFDLDAALASFELVDREVPRLLSVHWNTEIKIGQVLTAKGDTARAAIHFQGVARAPNATPDQQDEASFRLAELRYFGGKFDEASQLLDGISTNLKADYTNDALLLQTFLQENKQTAEPALKEFARADFLARQQKNTEAIAMFQKLVDQYPQALLLDDALMRIALLQTRTQLYPEAIATYEKLLTKFKESSIALDKAAFNVAEIYDIRLKDKPKAIIQYENFLAGYPQSLMLDRARKRIRELRGDSL